MSFLAEVSAESLQFDSNVAVTSGGSGSGVATATYEYHLPHTKTLDLIGEEFAPRKTHHLAEAGPNVVVVSAMPTGVSGSLLPANLTPMVITSSAHGDSVHHTHISTTSAGGGATAIPLSTVIDLPSLAAGAADDNGGVLLCNLDELSRYIPENFCNENMLDSNNLEATTFAPSLSTATATKLSSTSISLSNGAIFQAAPISSCGNFVTVSSAATPITITLPTQPQPLHSVKSVTYVQGQQPIMSSGFKVHHQQSQQMSPQLQPVKFTTTGYAIGPSGERIAIQGLTPHDPHRQHQTLQLVKTSTAGGSLQQAIQFNFDPSKFTVLHELPDVSKFVIQEQRSNHDSITTILEEMRSGEEAPSAGVEYTTAIPVALASLTPDPKKAGLTRIGGPSTIVLPAPGKKGSPRNFIFAGNTLPQGAIPIQLNGLNAMPLSAVKSIPLPVNLSTLAPHGGQATTVLTTATLPTQPHPPQSPIAAKKTKVEVLTSIPVSVAANSANTRASAAMAAATVTNIVNKISNNNNTHALKPGGGAGSRPLGTGAPANRVNVAAISAAGGNKTCTWQFENGEICGKTFSKSYNLVVHMRMHEDVRPFQCGLCDQTFRQKAHLQRHETTHGIGTKVSRSTGSSSAAASSSSSGFSSSKRRRRNRSSGGGGGGGGGRAAAADPPTPVISASLQERLARVNQQFGKKTDVKAEDSHDEEDQHEDLYDSVGSAGDGKDDQGQPPVLKSYSPKRKLNGSSGLQEVVLSSDVTAVGQILEFKEVASCDDGDADGALAKAAKLRRLSVRLERLGDDSEDTKGDEVSAAVRAIQADDGDNSVPTTMAGLSSAYVEVSEALMHDHHATDLSQSFAAAVNEAVGGSGLIEVQTEASQGHIVTLTQAMADGSLHAAGNKTIVIEGFDEQNPDVQKEILKAILAGSGSSAAHAGSISVVTTTSAGTFLGDHMIVKGRDDSSNVKVEHVEANTYSPMASQEFHEQH